MRHLFRVQAALLVVIITVTTTPVLAVGVGVTPGRMAFSVRPGASQVQTLRIVNQDSQPANLEVYVEGAHDKWVRITPDEFTLDSQEQKDVTIEVAPPITASPEEYNLTICIVSMPTSSDLRVGAGVRVDAQIEVTKFPIMPIQWWIVSAIILAAIVTVGILIWRRTKVDLPSKN